MFVCHYDGCDSDSELSSEACSQEEVDYVAYSKSEAQKFESIMNDELDAIVQDLVPCTRRIGGRRKVHFHASTSEHEGLSIQRDSLNRTHYRSTYPINCAADETSQPLPPDIKLNRNKKPKRDNSLVHGNESGTESNAVSPVGRLFAVSCDICDAPVGVKDVEAGVVTFTNVLASHT
ncbi:uncharacterized protein DEA37_0002438 [Paragonimus westermani]|uniref:Uncharacterized protein n=1 Tax=Paragonimus westermani TaxID=34504 RepID=A0A5J4NPI7_9TREM|nr:uncharacterized protein DEA37_0002438 [Paragonimus westermani]